MKIPFTVIDWSLTPKKEKPGERGTVTQQVMEYPGLKIRLVEYSSGYVADHWCQKGHIVYCLHGEFESEMENGEIYKLSTGMTYIVSDNMSSHRSRTAHGAKMLIIDGDLLNR